MADNRTMAQMLQAPIEGYEDAIVVPQINANNFELKQTLINLVQSNQFTKRQDPHNHLRFFNKVTSTFRHPEVPNTTVKVLLWTVLIDSSLVCLTVLTLIEIIALEMILVVLMSRLIKSRWTHVVRNILTVLNEISDCCGLKLLDVIVKYWKILSSLSEWTLIIAMVKENQEKDKIGSKPGKNEKRKQHKASCKTKLVNSVSKPLHTLHMDLFGHTSVSSLNHKWYCLVATDDFSRFTWTFFLKTKDQTSGILRNFITEIENLKHLKVKIIRCNNEGEFKNKEMHEFCTKKGIKREFSNARTPQQIGVAKKRNRTLIKAARTMLADAKLLVTFWAEVVNTACYVQNRVLVNKSQNKTSYELFNSKTPAIGFLKPFRCHVMIFNTLDHLGSLMLKGIKVILLVVIAGTSSTNISGTKDAASQGGKKDVSSLRYIALTNWFHEAHMESSNNNAQDACNADAPESRESPIPLLLQKVSQLNKWKTSSGSRLISKEVFSQEETPSLDNILTLLNMFEDILGDTTNTVDTNGVEADSSNMETNITASPTPTFRIHKDYPKSQIIGPVNTPAQTRHKSKEMEEHSFIATIHQKTTPNLLQFCLFSCFLSKEEPKKIFDALKNPCWVEAMQEELLQFQIQNVWILVDCPKRVRPIGTKWVLKNKKDKRWIVIRNKARLVAQGHTHEEGIDYEDVFAAVARIEAIRLFLAYASFMGFTVYQMDVKSSFLYGTIDEEVYVMQPPGFQDLEFPDRVYKVEKAMHGLHQASRAWYGTLSKYLLANSFQRGTIDQTLFINKHRGYFLLVQMYVDDIIFGSSNPQLCREVEALMHDKF
nr:hypothetical protein [Tanacetum cinerariifolium]